MSKTTLLTVVAALLIGAGITYAIIQPSETRVSEMAQPSSSKDLADNPFRSVPVINAYYEGQEIWFIHTEVSDEGMAQVLSNMMNMMGVDHPTIYSPRLGEVQKDVAGKLYVFTNGVRQVGALPWGGGPFGYQIDIFDSVPGQSDYTPLRNPYLVTWNESATPRLLKSADEVLAAERNGELTIKQADAIVNAPIIHWPENAQETQPNRMMGQ